MRPCTCIVLALSLALYACASGNKASVTAPITTTIGPVTGASINIGHTPPPVVETVLKPCHPSDRLMTKAPKPAKLKQARLDTKGWESAYIDLDGEQFNPLWHANSDLIDWIKTRCQ